MANQLWCIDFLTPPTPLIIPHRLPAFHESLMPLKNRCLIHARWSKSSLKHSICGILWHFSKFKTEFYCISSLSSCLDCIFEIDQLWQSVFSRVYYNCCCSCSFEAEIIKIGQSSHKMDSNNSEFSKVYNNFKCLYKKVWKTIECTTYFTYLLYTPFMLRIVYIILYHIIRLLVVAKSLCGLYVEPSPI